MSMQIIPAIDLLEGGCVRLKYGDFTQRQNYDADPLELADRYAREGARWLHVVDLAASRDGASADRFAGWLSDFGPERLVAALDVQIDDSGVPWPRTHGWTKGSARSLWQLLDFLDDKGLRHLLCTDIRRDGAMTGPNLKLYREIVSRYPALAVQASGGVSGLADLGQLSHTGADAAITGKALLEGCFTVADAMEFLA